jgi:hypothetical protein
VRVVVEPETEHLFETIKSIVHSTINCVIICDESNAVRARGYKTKVLPPEKLGAKRPIAADAHRQDLLITNRYSVVQRCAGKGTRIMDYAGNVYFCKPNDKTIYVKGAISSFAVPHTAEHMLPVLPNSGAGFQRALTNFVRDTKAAAARKKCEENAERNRLRRSREQQRREAVAENIIAEGQPADK